MSRLEDQLISLTDHWNRLHHSQRVTLMNEAPEVYWSTARLVRLFEGTPVGRDLAQRLGESWHKPESADGTRIVDHT